MNKILHNFGFGVVLKGETNKPKRTKESILGFRYDGVMLQVEYCLPKDRAETIQKMFNDFPKVTIINVKPLIGRTLVVKRETTQ